MERQSISTLCPLGSGKILIDQENDIYIDGTDSVFTNLFGISKLDSSGNLLYTRNFNLLNYSEILISDMKMDDSSNIYLTGNGFSHNSVYDFITYKLDTSLNEIWHVQFLDTNTLGESPTSLALDHNAVSMLLECPIMIRFQLLQFMFSKI